MINYETEPGSGIGFLAGWRGKGGEKFMRGEPNPNQWEMYAKNNCVYQHELPKSFQYMRNWNRGYLHWAQDHGLIRYTDPVNLHVYSEVLQRFRLAAEGKRPGRQPPEHLRERVRRHFDPLPFYAEPLETQATDKARYPLNAITQRPMAMYHSWDSQNAWLRQIHAHNYLFVSPKVGAQHGIGDGDWIWVESAQGRVRCMCRFSEAVEPGTVWTWNAIGKASGAWALDADANESQKGFLLNHLISEELPAGEGEHRFSNSDPVTGQAAWYDVRVRVYRADDDEPRQTWPQFDTQPRVPGMERGARTLAGVRPGDRQMTQLALVIDLNVCVGCHACVTSCKEWNTSGEAGSAGRSQPLRRRPDRHLLQPRADLRGRRVSEYRDRALPQVLPALRGPALRAGVPDRRQLQAPGGRHRAGRLRQVHRLQVLRLGLPLRRARNRRAAKGDEEVHAVRRPHLRRDAAGSRAQARLRAGLPDQRAPLRRRARSRLGSVEGDPRAGGYQLMPEWGTQPANHYLPRRKTEIRVHEEDLQRSDNPLRKEDRGRRAPTTRTTLDDSTSW